MYQISCIIAPELADTLEDYFCEYVRSNWSLLQVQDNDPFTLQGFFEDADEARAAYAELRADFPQLTATPEEKTIEDQEWKDAYKAFIQPWSHADLHWVPVWERESYELPAGDTAIYLDAGLAFGTGSHETTRLMARRLLEFRAARAAAGQAIDSLTLIDAGCGSGILAMSAAKLGLGDVMGFDRDPEAVRVAEENRGFNGLADDAVAFEENGIEEALAGGRQADCILANIQADVLKIYAEVLLRAVKPGGLLALSGILAEEVDSVRKVFTPLARDLFAGEETGSRADGIWCDLCYTRPA